MRLVRKVCRSRLLALSYLIRMLLSLITGSGASAGCCKLVSVWTARKKRVSVMRVEHSYLALSGKEGAFTTHCLCLCVHMFQDMEYLIWYLIFHRFQDHIDDSSFREVFLRWHVTVWAFPRPHWAPVWKSNRGYPLRPETKTTHTLLTSIPAFVLVSQSE